MLRSFTGVLASFGIQTASKKGDGTMKMNGNGNGNGGAPPVTAKDIEAIMAKAPAGPVQTLELNKHLLRLPPMINLINYKHGNNY